MVAQRNRAGKAKKCAKIIEFASTPGSIRYRRSGNIARHCRYQHGYLSAILRVLRMLVHQIPLLELDSNKDVGRRNQREEQMGQCHRRRAPEGEEPADVERM